MLSGTFIQDVPFLVVRLWTAAVTGDSRSSGPGFSLLYALLLKSACAVAAAAVALVVSPAPAGELRDLEPDDDDGGGGQVRYRGLVRRRSGSLTADGLVQQLPHDIDADDEHFV